MSLFSDHSSKSRWFALIDPKFCLLLLFSLKSLLSSLCSLLSRCHLAITTQCDIHPDWLPQERSHPFELILVLRSIGIQSHQINQCNPNITPRCQHFAQLLAFLISDLLTLQLKIKLLIDHLKR